MGLTAVDLRDEPRLPDSWAECWDLVRADAHRIASRSDTRTIARLARRLPGFRYCLLLRLCSFTHRSPQLRRTVHWPLRALYRRYTYLYGISIPYSTRIGGGLYIGHFGGIVVNASSVIGRNCNISHGVTLGQANRGGNAGVPTVGNQVYIGPGAKLVGDVTISDGVAIGANCVVTKDAPTNAVVVGIPGKVISLAGSGDYVNRTDYVSAC